MLPRLYRSTLFPYTTLFRSVESDMGALEDLVTLLGGALRRFQRGQAPVRHLAVWPRRERDAVRRRHLSARSEEHTSELQLRLHLVCRLLLEKKNIQIRLAHV